MDLEAFIRRNTNRLPDQKHKGLKLWLVEMGQLTTTEGSFFARNKKVTSHFSQHKVVVHSHGVIISHPIN